MKALAAALLVFVAACGRGKAIFNIDAYSFMAGTGKDTIPYIIPPTGGTASTVQKINLPPGFGSSIVDSIKITTGNATLMNTGGTGTIGFQLYFAADSAATFTTPDTALSIPATAVSGAQTVPVVITGDVSNTVNSLFTKQTVWMRIAATGTNTGLGNVTGKGVLTALVIRVVLQDKIF